MSRKHEEKLAAQLDEDLDDDTAWEDDPAPEGARKRRLGAQVTVRLDAAHAELLRRIAKRRGVGHTSLVRSWVEERLAKEASGTVVMALQHAQPGAASGGEVVQITGNASLLTPVQAPTSFAPKTAHA